MKRPRLSSGSSPSFHSRYCELCAPERRGWVVRDKAPRQGLRVSTRLGWRRQALVVITLLRGVERARNPARLAVATDALDHGVRREDLVHLRRSSDRSPARRLPAPGECPPRSLRVLRAFPPPRRSIKQAGDRRRRCRLVSSAVPRRLRSWKSRTSDERPGSSRAVGVSKDDAQEVVETSEQDGQPPDGAPSSVTGRCACGSLKPPPLPLARSPGTPVQLSAPREPDGPDLGQLKVIVRQRVNPPQDPSLSRIPVLVFRGGLRGLHGSPSIPAHRVHVVGMDRARHVPPSRSKSSS